MTGLRAVTRLAVRESRRRPWRSLLVIVLIALPTAAATFVSTWLRTSVDTPEEQVAQQIGQADYVVDPGFGPDGQPIPTSVTEIRTSLRQPGVRFVEFGLGTGLIASDRGPRKRVRVPIVDLDLADPITRGMFELTDGRLPTATLEVAVDEDWLARLGKAVGDSITMLRPNQTVRVTGSLAQSSAVYGGAIVGPGLRGGSTSFRSPRFLVAAPGGAQLPPISDADRGVVTRRDELLAAAETRPNDTLFLYVFGALGMAAFGLIVSSALAVGARRQLRALGLLLASGGSPRHARALILMQGVVLGLVGAVVGVIVGLGSAGLARPLVEKWAGEAQGPLTVRLVDCVVIAVFALAVAVGAAWGPASSAAGTSVLHALGGRRPLSRLGVRVPLTGFVVSGLGCAILGWAVTAAGANSDTRALVAGVGSAVIVAGLVACMPYLIGLLDGLAGNTSGTLRLAARTVARQRSRTGPTAAAIMAAGALAVAVASVSLSQEARNHEAYTPFLPKNAVQINASVDDFGHSAGTLSCPESLAITRPLLATAVPSATATCATFETAVTRTRDGFGYPVAILAAVDLPRTEPADYRSALARGDAVYIGEDPPPVASLPATRGDAIRIVSGPASASVLPHLIGIGLFVVSDRVAERLDLSDRTRQTLAIAYTPEPITGSQRRALDRLNALDPGADLSTAERDVYVSFNYERGPGALSETEVVIYAIILPAAILLALLTALIGLALTAAETRDEQATIVAVGAGPSHRRRQNAWQALLVVGVGSLLAIPGGLVPAAIILSADGVSGTPMITPWLLLLALGVGLPLLAAAGAAALTKARMRPLATRVV